MPDLPTIPDRRSDLDPETEALADRFVACIEAGDVDGVAACFGPGALIWHNNDSLEVPPEKVLRILAWLAANVTGLRYDVTRRRAIAGGYVQQHVLRGTAPNGSELAVEACLIVELVDGRISRLEEYLDTAQVDALT
jgi:ketosteroid isomerase-like protein